MSPRRLSLSLALLLALPGLPALAAGETVSPVSGLPMPAAGQDTVVVADPAASAAPRPLPLPLPPAAPETPTTDRPRTGGGFRITPDGTVTQMPGAPEQNATGGIVGGKVIRNDRPLVEMPGDIALPGEVPSRAPGVSTRVRTPGTRMTPDGKVEGAATAIAPPAPDVPAPDVPPLAQPAMPEPGQVPLGLGATTPLPATGTPAADPWQSLPNGAEAVLFGLSPAGAARVPAPPAGPRGDMPTSLAQEKARAAAAAPPPLPVLKPPPAAAASKGDCPQKTRISRLCADDPTIFESVGKRGPGQGCRWAVAEIGLRAGQGVLRFRYPMCDGARRKPSYALDRNGRLTEKVAGRPDRVVAVIYATGSGNARARLEGIRQGLQPHIRRQCQVTALTEDGSRLAITPTADYAAALATLRWPGPVCGTMGRRDPAASDGTYFLARKHALVQLPQGPAILDRESLTIDR